MRSPALGTRTFFATPAAAGSACTDEHALAVLQHPPLRTACRFMREEPLPERTRRRAIEGGGAEARYGRFRVSMSHQAVSVNFLKSLITSNTVSSRLQILPISKRYQVRPS